MTTLTICFDPGPLAIHSTYWVMLATVGYVAYWLGKNSKDRAVTIDQTRRNVAAWQATYGLAIDDSPVLVNRVDAETTIFRRHAYKSDPHFDWREAA